MRKLTAYLVTIGASCASEPSINLTDATGRR